MYSFLLKNKLAQKKMKNIIHSTSRIGLLSTIQGSTLGAYTLVSAFATITGSILGDYTYLNRYSWLDHTVIGKFSSIASHVSIGLYEHNLCVTTHPFYHGNLFGNLTSVNTPYDNAEITKIGNDVWIGTHATILKGVKVSDGAIVGAGSVVTKDVPPYSIVIGNPATILRYRFDEDTIKIILGSKWWEYERELLKEMIDANAFRDINIFKKYITL